MQFPRRTTTDRLQRRSPILPVDRRSLWWKHHSLGFEQLEDRLVLASTIGGSGTWNTPGGVHSLNVDTVTTVFQAGPNLTDSVLVTFSGTATGPGGALDNPPGSHSDTTLHVANSAGTVEFGSGNIVDDPNPDPFSFNFNVSMNNVGQANGMRLISYRVSRDGDFATSTAVSGFAGELVDINNRPVANNQTIGGTEDTDLPITLGGSDVNSDPLTFRVTSLPSAAEGTLFQSNGVTVINVNDVVTGGNLIFRPTMNFNGASSFQFRVEDDRSGVSTNATVNVNLADAPPATPGVPMLVTDTGMAGDMVTSTAQLSITGGEAGSNVFVRRSDMTVLGPAPGPGTVTITDNAEGSWTYVSFQTETTGMMLSSNDSAASATIMIDRTLPVGTITFRPIDAIDTGNPMVPGTGDRTPLFRVDFSEQQGLLANDITVQIVSIDGGGTMVTLPITIAAGTNAGALATLGQTVFIESADTLAIGAHSATIRVTDDAGNFTDFVFNFEVVDVPSSGSPHTPVFTTAWDLFAALGGHIQPWQTSFDPTTQTFWFSTESGNQIVQFDPATGIANVHDVSIIDGMNVLSVNPHGTFFDFESHINPRIWWVTRNAEPMGFPPRLGFLDIRTNQMYSFELPTTGHAHAVFVDARGNVFLSDEREGKIFELDLDFNPDGSVKTTLDGKASGRLIEHVVPTSLLAPGVPGITPHGLDVVIDDETGEAWVWFTLQDSGRIALLRPGAGPGGADQWYTWDFTSHMAAEGRMGATPGHALFLQVDNNETPGDPTDDLIIVNDPARTGAAAGSLRVLDPRAAVAAIKAGTAVPTTAGLTTYRIPDIHNPGEFGRINQPYVDRLGTIYFIDRDGAIGRLEPSAASDEGFAPTVPLVLSGGNPFHSSTPLFHDSGVPFNAARAPVTIQTVQDLAFFDSGRQPDESSTPGLGLWDQSTSNALNRNNDGPFRGQFTAGGVLFGSVQRGGGGPGVNDRGVVNIFAETARRQMAAVATADGGRLAFQVRRDGHVILSGRSDSDLIDKQVDLTAALGAPAIYGDVSAIEDTGGVVHVFGRSLTNPNQIVEYRRDAKGVWTIQAAITLADVASDPTAFIDPSRGIGVAVTTGAGALLVYFPDFLGGQTVDLSATSTDTTGGQTLVYSQVGAVAVAGQVFIYGTNQAGGMIEYSFSANGADLSGVGAAGKSIRRVVADGMNVFQDVSAITDGVNKHVFATANALLKHVRIDGAGAVTIRDVTAEAQAAATGYADFQQPFAARVFSGLAPIHDAAAGTLYVYGVNGRDLVEFQSTGGGAWSAHNLTNDTNRGGGEVVEANRVFGAPGAYILASGDRHIVQINADGEVVEYYFWNSDGRFHTQNITLGQLARFGGLSNLTDLGMSVGPLHAAEAGAGASSILTSDQLAPIVAEAIARYAAAGLPQHWLDQLAYVSFAIRDLNGTLLGLADRTSVVIDADAAGNGWFVDSTPGDDSEFAGPGAEAKGIDLLSVVMHELGHTLGLEHSPDDGDSDAMDERIEVGRRFSLKPGDIDLLFDETEFGT